ncbi:MAG: hypothetical protein K6D59_06020 [Bacteroidales bacterium]|nr:hypothetical protein [Bacteroidales bacterium]
MILVADSGSTKTTWADIESGNKVVTEGLNPYFSSEQQVLEACAIVRQQFKIQNSKFKIHFYGAGCGLPEQRGKVAAWLAKAFGTSDVHVETDMLGACRATAGDQPALVGILGTGSNACYYDGERITLQSVSTGYILGDRGSANHVGRVLLNDYLTHHMPEELRLSFHDTYPMNNAELMDAVYHQPNPNRFLASLAPFAVKHFGDDYCRHVVEWTLKDWLKDALMPLWRQVDDVVALHVVGSYAKAIESTLRLVMEVDGLDVGTVVADPIDGLIEYHRLSKKS